MKIITVCGSLRFKNELMETAIKMELKGNCILAPVFSDNINKDAFSDEEFKVLGDMHKEKIKLSDAILVIDVDGYIGSATQGEIEYAKSLGKEVIYYSELIEKGIL